jgi:hypothetical protein
LLEDFGGIFQSFGAIDNFENILIQFQQPNLEL